MKNCFKTGLRFVAIAFIATVMASPILLRMGARVAQAAAPLSVTMRPPYGTNPVVSLAQIGMAGVAADSLGNYVVTDPQSAKALLSYGWVIVAEPLALGNITGTVNLDLSKSCSFSGTLTGAVTLTATHIGLCAGQSVSAFLKQNSGGTNTVTLSTGFLVNSGAPVMKTGAAATDLLTFADNGTALEYPGAGANGIQGTGQGTFTISWDGPLGSFTSAANAPALAPCTGHFTGLVCAATLTGSCTTGPSITVSDLSGTPASGTAVSPGTTVASPAPTAETLAFSAGDTIALAAAATPSACASPSYHCAGTAVCP